MKITKMSAGLLAMSMLVVGTTTAFAANDKDEAPMKAIATTAAVTATAVDRVDMKDVEGMIKLDRVDMKDVEGVIYTEAIEMGEAKVAVDGKADDGTEAPKEIKAFDMTDSIAVTTVDKTAK